MAFFDRFVKPWSSGRVHGRRGWFSAGAAGWSDAAAEERRSKEEKGKQREGEGIE
jgi:hypothetical protein